MKNLVIVTSAINVNTGIFPPKQRFYDTCRTIDSIRENIPNSFILINETSPCILDISYKSILENNVDMFIISNTPQIVYFGDKQTLCTSSAEICGFIELFSNNEFLNILAYVDRIIKVSGRYTITSEFNMQNHIDHNKYTFKKKWWYGTGYLRDTRCWSMPISLLNHFKTILPIAFDKVQQYKQDIEHSMVQLIPDNMVNEYDVIGVKGITAHDGIIIKE